LTEKQIDFNIVFHIKCFIKENKISKNLLSRRLVENLTKAEKLYKNFYFNKKEKEMTQSTMTIYFNILSMIELDDFKILNKKDVINFIDPKEYSADKEHMENLKLLKSMFKGFISNPSLFKFKNLYEKFLNNYTELLKLESIISNNKDNNEQIIMNLINISSLRKLSEDEQTYISIILFYIIILYCLFTIYIINIRL
jgi:hypothetical protein